MEESAGKKIWEKSLDLLKGSMEEKDFHMWINPIKFVSYNNGSFHLEVPNRGFAEWVENNYLDAIKKTLSLILDKEPEIIFTYPKTKKRKTRLVETLPPFVQGELEFQSALNPAYTFEEFVVGPGNRFAHAASLAVAQSPGKAYNPLFIYGGVGLGKTHLIQAIGHYIRETKKRMRAYYTSSESFTNQLITAIQNKNTEKFRKRYRSVDVLLIDDIHFIAGKESTEEEFFHTFNELYNAGKQIVITADRPPSEIPTVEKRLVSRFQWGLVVEIQPPDFETRVAILRKKASSRGFVISDEVLYYIAQGITSNIRELEGALIKVMAYSTINKIPVDKNLVKEVLKDIIPLGRESRVSVEKIKNAVIEFFQLKPADLISKKRAKSIALPRQIAMYLTRELTELSLPEIGLNFGGRDHTTVLHACEKIRKKIEEDEKFKEIVEALKKKIVYGKGG
ncbi:chromosomal replication initiator protein DnaA [Candidatus Calescamantes bacterium]|nr:chromosomal replication initiator protein DnaA [Candidatus Calescamantes bacterium]